MRFRYGVVLASLVLAMSLWAGGAVAAQAPVPPAASSAAASLVMPTHVGPDGVPVPLGACAVVQGGKVLVLACDSPQAKAYKARLAAAATRRQAQHQALWGWGGVALGLLIGLAIVVRLERRGRKQRVSDAGAASGPEAPREPLPAEADAEHDTNTRLGA